MSEDVWTAADPDEAHEVVVVEHSEIVIEPEPPDERLRDAAFANEEQEEAAREAARAAFINARIVGASNQPAPQLEGWPERYVAAFRDELARLEAAGRA